MCIGTPAWTYWLAAAPKGCSAWLDFGPTTCALPWWMGGEGPRCDLHELLCVHRGSFVLSSVYRWGFAGGFGGAAALYRPPCTLSAKAKPSSKPPALCQVGLWHACRICRLRVALCGPFRPPCFVAFVARLSVCVLSD